MVGCKDVVGYRCPESGRYSKAFGVDLIYSHSKDKKGLSDLDIRKSLLSVLIRLRMVTESHLSISNEQIQKCIIYVMDMNNQNVKDKIVNFSC